MRRTHPCGALRAEHDGTSVTLLGWVNRARDLGGLVFVDLRDRTGMTQVVIDAADASVPDAGELRAEYL